MNIKNPDIDRFISDVAANGCDFYRTFWGKKRKFEELPLMTREMLIKTPLSRRVYKDETSLVKIVHTALGSFLSQWSYDDIAREPWGEKFERPLVYMTSSHEAVEKSLWCYENGVLPLIGERDPDVAAHSASLYDVNELITDLPAAVKLRSYLEGRGQKLESITMIGDTFDRKEVESFVPYAKKLRLVLALPETGAIATGSPDDTTFSPVPGCIVEDDGGEYAITKVAPLVTPIIRYKCGLASKEVTIS